MSDTSIFAVTAFITTLSSSPRLKTRDAVHCLADAFAYNKARAASAKTIFNAIFIGFGVKAQLKACRRELTKKGSLVCV
jgi:hypothetical protein